MSCAFRPQPLQTAQHRELKLDATGGIRGYRVAFVGPASFEEVVEVPTLTEACDLRRAGITALDDLARVFRSANEAAR